MSTVLQDRPAESGTTARTVRNERRHAPRLTLDSCATAFCLGGGRFGQIHSMKTRDYCREGFSALSSRPLEPGCAVSIGFEATDCRAQRGIVLRCEPSRDGFRIAVRFEGWT